MDFIFTKFLGESSPMQVPAFSYVYDDLSAFGSSTIFGQRMHHSGVSVSSSVVDDVISQLPYFYFV